MVTVAGEGKRQLATAGKINSWNAGEKRMQCLAKRKFQQHAVWKNCDILVKRKIPLWQQTGKNIGL